MLLSWSASFCKINEKLSQLKVYKVQQQILQSMEKPPQQLEMILTTRAGLSLVFNTTGKGPFQTGKAFG